jgi:redox-sensitive bicupin YhaK (pirin superfamily)
VSLDEGGRRKTAVAAGRTVRLDAVRGRLTVNGRAVEAREIAEIGAQGATIEIAASTDAVVILNDDRRLAFGTVHSVLCLRLPRYCTTPSGSVV